MANKKQIDYYGDWFKTVNKGSKSAYTSAWRTLIEFYKEVKGKNITPNDLLKMMVKDRKQLLENQGSIERDLTEWSNWLKDDYTQKVRGRFSKSAKESKKGKGTSAATIRAYLSAVKSFFSYYGYPLIRRRINLPLEVKANNGKQENDKIEYRPEQVKKLLDVIRSPRDRAITLVMFQSGMDLSTTLGLNYGDLKEQLEAGEEPILIKTQRFKTKIKFRTFIGHDAIQSLKVYLDIRRKKYKERIGYDTPLFTVEGKRVLTKERAIPKHYQDAMRKYALLSGIVSKEKMERADFNPARSHALRAGFSSIARLKGFSEGLINYLTGHKDEYNNAYNIMTDQELKEKYQSIEPHLSITSVSNMNDMEANLRKEIEQRDDRITGMEQRVEKLQNKNLGMEQKISDLMQIIEGVKKDVEELRKEA